MGEQSLPPNQNGFNGQNDETAMEATIESDGEEEQEQEQEQQEEVISAEDFQTLNNQIDALNSVLDRIEQKNASIHSELLALLQSNRAIRLQLQNEAVVNKNSKQ